MKQGEIYLVKFDPSFGHEYKGVRPAIVLQNEVLVKDSQCITIMPITSQQHAYKEFDIFVNKDRKNRLINDSIIKVQYMMSYDKTRFIKKIGEVSSPVLRKVRGYLRKHFLL